MKIELTKEGLKVNKFNCKSVTVYELEDKTFEGILFDIEGVTKRVPILNDLGNIKTSWQGKHCIKVTKLKKTIKSKKFEYNGLKMNKFNHIGKDYFFATNGAKSNYINYYPFKLDAFQNNEVKQKNE